MIPKDVLKLFLKKCDYASIAEEMLKAKFRMRYCMRKRKRTPFVVQLYSKDRKSLTLQANSTALFDCSFFAAFALISFSSASVAGVGKETLRGTMPPKSKRLKTLFSS